MRDCYYRYLGGITLRKNNKTHKGVKITVGVCNKCGKIFDDIKPYRKYECQDCWNTRSRTANRKKASTVEGYLSMTLQTIKNEPRRNRYYNDIDLDFLLKLYELQDGKCALTGIKMTIGYANDIYEEKREKIYRNPFNLSVDRIDSERGYVKDNVIMVCSCVNFFKNNLTVEQVCDVAKQIVDNNKRWTYIRSLIDKELLHNKRAG